MHTVVAVAATTAVTSTTTVDTVSQKTSLAIIFTCTIRLW